MSVWELALLLVAITYMGVNAVYMVIMVKTLSKYDGLLTKCIKVLEKTMENAEKEMNDLYGD